MSVVAVGTISSIWRVALGVATGLGRGWPAIARFGLAGVLSALFMTNAPGSLARDAGDPGFGVHVGGDATDRIPGVTAHDFYLLLDDALGTNFDSVILVFAGCYSGEFMNKLDGSKVGKSGKKIAAMSATGDKECDKTGACSQLFECTPANSGLANPFLEGVIDGFGGKDAGWATALDAFNAGKERQDRFVEKWNTRLRNEKDSTDKPLDPVHPSKRMLNGGEKLTLPQNEKAKKHAIIWMGRPKTAYDWRDYANQFLALKEAGYDDIQGFFGAGERGQGDNAALLPNGHSVVEDAAPEEKVDKNNQKYGGHPIGSVITDYPGKQQIRENGVTKFVDARLPIPISAATITQLKAALKRWKKVAGENCNDVFYFSAAGHSVSTALDRKDLLSLLDQKKRPSCREPGTTFGSGDEHYVSVPPEQQPPTETVASGAFFGLGVIGSRSATTIVERDANTGDPTNEFRPSRAAAGVSGEVGYDIPIGNTMILGGILAANAALRTDQHRFPNGASLATSMTWSGSALAKIGFVPLSGVAVSALAGISVASEELRIRLGTPFTARQDVVGGFTFGGEVEARFGTLSSLLGRPVTGVLQYTHTNWEAARANRPLGSPNFSYRGRMRDDMLKVGLRAFFN